MKLALVIVLLLLNILNVFLHTLGTYLLVCLCKHGTVNAQQIYLINLSMCEALMNLLEALRRIPDLIGTSDAVNDVISEVQTYMLIVMFTGISFVFYLDMIYLTVDRLLDIWLNLTYPVYWNEFKAKRLLQGTWVIGAVLSIVISLLHHFVSFKWQEPVFKFFYPTLGFGFIILALVTYCFIFHKYASTRGLPTENRRIRPRRINVIQVFRKSRFYVPVMLILTFIIFMVIPDLTYLFVGIIGGEESPTLLIVCWICYAVSNLADAWIYIFEKTTVRRMLFRKLNIRRHRVGVEMFSGHALAIMQVPIPSFRGSCRASPFIIRRTLRS